MNVLLITDDGPASVGLALLEEAARSHFGAAAKLIKMSTAEPKAGSSFSITPGFHKGTTVPYIGYEEVSPYTFVVQGTPVDCLYLGMLYPLAVLGTARFDAVLSGVNQGANVGVDVFHSGTVAVASLAATLFGVTSVALSQAMPGNLEGDFEVLNDRKYFTVAEFYLKKVMANHDWAPGSCINVNFPAAGVKGYKSVPPAAWSRWLPSTPTHDRQNDISALEDGFITVSMIELTTSPSAHY